MDYRIERDSMGEMEVPADRYWGAQTSGAIRTSRSARRRCRRRLCGPSGF